jgi:hypothetical protein
MKLLPVTERTQRVVRADGHDSSSRSAVHNLTSVPTWAATIGHFNKSTGGRFTIVESVFNSKEEIK